MSYTPPTKEEALEKITALVNRFKEQRDTYIKTFNETQTRRDFIDPFWKALGWDIDNENNSLESYREVIMEDKVNIAGTTKNPDYSFKLPGGKILFYLEAKKPSVNIKEDPSPAIQVRRYGWSAGLQISILTNFDCFIIYDCNNRTRQSDKASVGRIDILSYEDYLTKFDFLWDTFSRVRVQQGGLDKYTQNDKNKKGTTPVDEELLAEIENWRVELAKNIAKNNPDLSIYNLNTVVQKIIDRIIFIRIAEDRGIEDNDLLLSISKVNNVYERLNHIFTKVNIKYNSEIFAYHEWEERIKIDDKVLSNIITNLYYPECPYEFSVLPVEILGNIYERFLGKTIKFRGIKGDIHTAIIEEKPEVKKAGGIFYTPQYIVNYIVQNTVGEKIKNKKPEDISELKIVDPACGSGSFLVGAYQYLLNYHLNYYTKEKNISTSLKNCRIYQYGTNSYRLTIEEKQRILINNIYGVDIDNQAVEVTKLSLYLKLLESEEKGWLINYTDRALLPVLETNIKCGNSLIGTDYYSQGNLDFTDEERIKVNCFDWEMEFSDIFNSGGFDVVIGNPPYVRIQTIDKNTTDYLKKCYMGAGYGNYDLYILFIERSLAILSENGLYGMILPNKFFLAEYGEGIRSFIANGKNVIQINNFTTNQVFKNATTYTCLLFLTKKPNKNLAYQEIKMGLNIPNSLSAPIFDNISSEKLTGKWNFNSSINEVILEKISQNNILLQQISRKIFKGSSTGNDEVYLVQLIERKNKYSVVYSAILDENIKIENGLLKPFIYGQDVRRYFVNNTNNYLIFPYEIKEKATLIKLNILKSLFPLGYEYFEKVKKILMKRKLEISSNDFYKYSAGRSLSEYEQKKILIPDMLVDNRMAIDISGEYFHGPAIHSLIINEKYGFLHYNYILALLSSKIFWFFISNTSTALRGNAYRLTPEYINFFPVKVIDKSNNLEIKLHDDIVSFVNKILDLKKQEADEQNPKQKEMITRQIAGIDNAINKAVYELYELTEDEVKVVEGTI